MGMWHRKYVQPAFCKTSGTSGTVDHLALFTISYLKLERVVLQEIKKLFVERKSTWTLEGTFEAPVLLGSRLDA
jgi:hypothetical protein